MEIDLPGSKTYVAAISGGVDSMVLLDLLIKNRELNNWQIIVAHINHGIRHDSLEDQQLVEKTAHENGLMFESTSLNLAANASESLARTKRYEFLESLVSKYKADAIITAHHQDDLIETAIINLIRGTGRKGLSPLINNKTRLRPLINYSKPDLINYAKGNKINWREDSTNSDPSYLRNYIRLNILPGLDASARLKFVSVIHSMSTINAELDAGLSDLTKCHMQSNELDRNWFTLLPHNLAREVLASWLRANNLASFNRLTLERLVVSAKVARARALCPIYSNRYLIINKTTLSLS
jgi:tRNA(Ile)-lysidine synthetase-like protein